MLHTLKRKMYYFLLTFLLLPNLTFSFAQRGFFDQFPNRYFVETGTWEGHGVIGAQIANCFSEIHSVELSETYYQGALNTFRQFSNVHIWFGDSGIVLADMIKNMNEPITFWLDGHLSDPSTAKGESNTPILKELECIKNHPIKTHTILIDDVRLFGTAEFDFITLDVIIQKLKEINPSYIISIADAWPYPQDILVAQPPKK